jgi:hypothetical protein
MNQPGKIPADFDLISGNVIFRKAVRGMILAKPNGVPLPVEAWRVSLERKNGWSMRFEGQFGEDQPIIRPSLFIRQAGSDLDVKAEGYEVA